MLENWISTAKFYIRGINYLCVSGGAFSLRIIALGDSPAEILNITAMTVKAARIFLGALLTGAPTRLPDADVWHLYRRQRYVAQ